MSNLFSMEAEQAVISSLIQDNSIMANVEFLKPSDFGYKPHNLIFEALKSEIDKGNDVDLSLMSTMMTEDMGDISYLVDIFKNNSSPHLGIAYARKVLELSLRRQSIKDYQKAIEGLQDSGVDYLDQVSKTSESVDTSIGRLSLGDVVDVETLVNMSIEEMEKSMSEHKTGISTGIREIDDRLGYRQLAIGEVTYLGALSKNGKTLFANTITARCQLEPNETAHVFSIEMPSLDMFNGIVSAMSGVPSNFFNRQNYYQRVYHNNYDEWMARWGKAAHELRESNKITIDGKKDVTMSYIISNIKKQHSLAINRGKRLRLVVIDHLHRISFDTSKKSMTYAMGDDVRALKNVASDLGIAVLLLGQMNESCKDREPTGYDILDTSRVRHEIQCFLGTKIFRDNGQVFFGIYADTHRYADHETIMAPAYMLMTGGVVRSLPEHMKMWTPPVEEKKNGPRT